jgi:hypothetical protein
MRGYGEGWGGVVSSAARQYLAALLNSTLSTGMLSRDRLDPSGSTGRGPSVAKCYSDTLQPLKRRSFLGQPAYWQAYAPTDLSSPFQDVDRGVVIPIDAEATAAINPAIR